MKTERYPQNKSTNWREGRHVSETWDQRWWKVSEVDQLLESRPEQIFILLKQIFLWMNLLSSYLIWWILNSPFRTMINKLTPISKTWNYLKYLLWLNLINFKFTQIQEIKVVSLLKYIYIMNKTMVRPKLWLKFAQLYYFCF